GRRRRRYGRRGRPCRARNGGRIGRRQLGPEERWSPCPQVVGRAQERGRPEGGEGRPRGEEKGRRQEGGREVGQEEGGQGRPAEGGPQEVAAQVSGGEGGAGAALAAHYQAFQPLLGR